MPSSYAIDRCARNTAGKLNSLMGSRALLDLSMETGFVKRVRKFRAPAMTMVAMRTIISAKTWSETTIWDEYIDAVRECGGERIERGVFHDHISKPAFAAFCHELYARLSREASLGELDQGAELVRAVSSKLPISDIVCIDGTESRAAPSLRALFKGKGEAGGSVKIHSMHSLRSCAEIQYSIGAGTSCERTALLEMEDLKGLLILADAGYFSAELCSELDRRGAWYIIKVPDSVSCKVIDFQKVGRTTPPSQVANAREIMEGSGLPDARDLTARNCSYDLNASTAGGFEHREVLVRRQDSDGRYGHGRFATNIPADVLDAFQISDTYRARWQIEIQFKCFKSFSNLKTDKIVTSSIIEAFLDLARAAHAVKLLLGQAAQKLLGTALSQQKVAERCNGKLAGILDAMIRGTGDLAGLIRDFLSDKALRLKKSSPSFINRKRGKSLLCVIRSMLGKCRTAAIHIPRLDSRPPDAG